MRGCDRLSVCRALIFDKASKILLHMVAPRQAHAGLVREAHIVGRRAGKVTGVAIETFSEYIRRCAARLAAGAHKAAARDIQVDIAHIGHVVHRRTRIALAVRSVAMFEHHIVLQIVRDDGGWREMLAVAVHHVGLRATVHLELRHLTNIRRSAQRVRDVVCDVHEPAGLVTVDTRESESLSVRLCAFAQLARQVDLIACALVDPRGIATVARRGRAED